MHRNLQVFILFIFLSTLVNAQRVSMQTVEAASGSVLADKSVTALALRSTSYMGESIVISLNGEPLAVPFDPDGPEFSYFISLSTPLTNLRLNLELNIPVELFIINSGTPPSLSHHHRQDQQECDFSFFAVPQAEWRAGLPAPNYSRSFTEVLHVVVHHSAGSNTATNYTQVVRDIYLYHTEVNGWSDIGYNYLIAQDGTIFAGRDPGMGEQDNVLGAHFCGSNSNTMGICLLGNYETASPSDPAWTSLEELTAYKLGKEQLDPMGNYPHAFGQLPAIAGHRDGCSTLCPGGHVYDQLNLLRSDVSQMMNDCGSDVIKTLKFTASELSPQVYEEVTFMNNSTGYQAYRWIFEGGDPDTASWTDAGKVGYFFPGNFSVTLIGINEVDQDTAFFANAMHVSGDVAVFPNPVAPTEQITIATEHGIDHVDLIGMNGICYPLRQVVGATYQIPEVRKGLYLLQISTNSGFPTVKKLSVR